MACVVYYEQLIRTIILVYPVQQLFLHLKLWISRFELQLGYLVFDILEKASELVNLWDVRQMSRYPIMRDCKVTSSRTSS
jgi:hypothetical protein